MASRLSVRHPRIPGRLNKTLIVEPEGDALNDGHHTILIHGYQNSEEKAERSYLAFEKQLHQIPTPRAAMGSIWHFHWPSDHPSKLISIATYSVRVPQAEQSAELLVDELLKDPLKPHQTVSLIAHSLGCLVALETARRIQQAGSGWPGAKLRHVTLLAAAVPQLECTPEEEFGIPLAGSVEHVFHSRKDKALGWKFDRGQHYVGRPGEAVGLDGRPPLRWSDSVPTTLGHSEYWSSPGVARRLSQVLGPTSPPRHMAVRAYAYLEPDRIEPHRRRLRLRHVRKRHM
jgi:pimeloyl-ACP methyl ester carboxylesterase